HLRLESATQHDVNRPRECEQIDAYHTIKFPCVPAKQLERCDRALVQAQAIIQQRERTDPTGNTWLKLPLDSQLTVDCAAAPDGCIRAYPDAADDRANDIPN